MSIRDSALAKLQGVWRPLEVTSNGKPVSPSMLDYGSRTQTGIEVKIVFAGRTVVHAEVRIDETAALTEIDYFHLSGPDQGTVSHGIFEWDNEIAVFCIASPGAPRPTHFASERNSGHTLSRWKRR